MQSLIDSSDHVGGDTLIVGGDKTTRPLAEVA
jgi:hypothetical protein